MSYTVQLSDGATTLDLIDGDAYELQEGGVRWPPPEPLQALGPLSLLRNGQPLIDQTHGNRTVTLRLAVLGTDRDGLAANLRDLQALIEKARVRQVTGHGADVTLTVQLDGASNAVIFDVLTGRVDHPSNLWNRPNLDLNNRIVGVRLALLCKPFARRSDQALTGDTLENHQASGAANHADFTSLVGDVDAPCQVKLVQGGATGSGKVWVATRSGTRRTDTLWRQGEGRDAWTSLGAVALTESTQTIAGTSGGDASRARRNSSNALVQELVCRWDFTMAGPPMGTFRLLGRVKATSTFDAAATKMSFGAGWSFGALGSTPAIGIDTQLVAVADTWEIMDFGEITIPPIEAPDGQTLADLELRIFGVAEENGIGPGGAETWDWFLDYVFLLPADEHLAILSDVASTDRILLDTITEHGQVYILDSSDKVQRVADYLGRPPMLSMQDTRLYVLRDDAPAVTFTLTGTYRPQHWDLP